MLKLKLWYFGCLMQRTDSYEKTLILGKIEGRRRRGWQRMRLLDGITGSMNMNLGKLQGMLKDSLACCSTWGWKELNTTEWLNNTTNGSRDCFNFIDLRSEVQIPNATCWRDFFSVVYSCPLCERLINCRFQGLFPCSLLHIYLHSSMYLLLCQYHTNYCSFVVLFEFWEGSVSRFVLFPLDYWIFPGSIQISELFAIILWKMSWVIWQELH